MSTCMAAGSAPDGKLVKVHGTFRPAFLEVAAVPLVGHSA